MIEHEDVNKTRRQYKCIDIWKENFRRGTLNLTRRFGKTEVAKKAINDYCKLQKELGLQSNVIILVPSKVTYMNMQESLKDLEHDVQIISNTELLDMVRTFNYKLDCDLLIIDEIHNCLSGELLRTLVNNRHIKYTLGLTGSTLTSEQIRLLDTLHFPVIDVITESEAVAQDWIAPFIEYNVPVELSEIDKNNYKAHTDIIRGMLENYREMHKRINTIFKARVFENDFSVLMACHSGATIDINNQKVFIKPNYFRNMCAERMGWHADMPLDNAINQQINKFWNPESIKEHAFKFNRCVKKRNEILVHNRNKVEAVVELIKKIDKPTIVFNEVTDMCDDLLACFDKQAVSYHSNIETSPKINPQTGDFFRCKTGKIKNIGKTALLKIVIENMRNGLYKYLFCAKALNEGLTIENIELVITTGGSTKPSTHEQRTSRGKTIDYLNPFKSCLIVNFYIDDFELNGEIIKSRDKQKLQDRQSTLSMFPIWVNSIEDIII